MTHGQQFRPAGAGAVPVALVACPDYSRPWVEAALGRLVSLVGGLEGLVAGKHVLLKPNFLIAKAPERAVNTHPEVIRAVAQAVLAAGASRVSVGDSPAFGPGRKVAARLGLPALLDPLGVEVVELDEPVEVRRPGARYPVLMLSRRVLTAEVVLNLGKVKTHGLCGLTLAVKNCFGAVVGLEKSAWHARAGRDAEAFAAMVVEVCRAVRPALSLLDGVVGMDGNGPSGGRARPLGFLAASPDPFLLDRSLARVLGVPDHQVLTFGPDGLGELPAELPGVARLGDPPERFRPARWAMPRRLPARGTEVGREGRATAPGNRVTRFFFGVLRQRLTPAPRWLHPACTRCGRCLEVCHSKALTLAPDRRHPSGRRVRLSREACIRCYCCQEVCPEGAIVLRRGWLGSRRPVPP